jgi:hypothetical protein
LFNADFYPTPVHVIDMMLAAEILEGKQVLEPSAGRGDIVDYCAGAGAMVSACEIEPDLQTILFGKCRVIAPDFLTLTSDQISHIDLIIMNPPFSADEKHINHAFDIAPPGCKIIALCNFETLNNRYSSSRRRLSSLVNEYGSYENLGDCFSDADRKTGVSIGLVKILKPGGSYETEFEGFFMGEEVEEAQLNGLMPYNFVRDVVNRYVAAVKLYDEQLAVGLKMNALLDNFYKSDLSFSCTSKGQPVLRNDFKKDLQKKAWNFIIAKMKMEKYTTKGLKEDLNKFVEKQHSVPFTMQNIYHMLQLIIGTHADRMGKALLEVFDKLTQHYDDNRYNVEGWKTNSHYLINEKFIMPYLTRVDYDGNMQIGYYSDSRAELIDDMNKALCWLLGENFDEIGTLYSFFHRQKPKDPHKTGYQRDQYYTYEFNTWYDFAFFSFKGFKKGTMHFKFKDKEVWGRFNQKIAQLKGYPLYEYKNKAA